MSQGRIVTFKGDLIVAGKAGFGFGFSMTAAFVVMELLAVIKFKDKKSRLSTTRVKKEIIVDLNYDDAFGKAVKTLEDIGARIIKEDKESGVLLTKKGFSMRSWGEKIDVKLERLNDNQTEINIFSRPKISGTLVDYGKNYENVEKFLQKYDS